MSICFVQLNYFLPRYIRGDSDTQYTAVTVTVST